MAKAEQNRSFRKLKMAAVMGGIVGAAVLLEARRYLLKSVEPSGVGVLVSVRRLAAGQPVALADFSVKWVRMGLGVRDFYSDQQWGELSGGKLVCDLAPGEPLSRACVTLGSRPRERIGKHPTGKGKGRSAGVVLWTEIGP